MKYIYLLGLLTFFACESVSTAKVETKPKTEATKTSNTVNKSAAFLSFTCKPDAVQMYWKADNDSIFKNFDALDKWLKSSQQKELIFAMNGGMFMEDNSPLGLYIENGKTIRSLNKRTGTGNFYIAPNGVFYITKNGKAAIVTSQNFNAKSVLFATQSGPMVVVDGKINEKLTKGSSNVNIRNGVGILPNGDCLFIMSKGFVNFYDFANYFVEQGCKNALYLDGAISKTYLPEQGYNSKTGNFGVIIGSFQKSSQ